jgi:transposase InsO family protein
MPLTAPRLRALHRAEDIGSVLKGGVNVCQRQLVNEVRRPLVTEFVRDFGREGATPIQRGSNAGLLGRVQAVKLIRHNALRLLRAVPRPVGRLLSAPGSKWCRHHVLPRDHLSSFGIDVLLFKPVACLAINPIETHVVAQGGGRIERNGGLFAVLVLGHGRRQLLWFAVTRHPTAEWLARQITAAFPWASAPAYLVRDNDRAYGATFRSRVRAMGIRDRPISPGSPWQNPYVERLIGTVRRECLDGMLVFGEAHLRQILSSYAAYYNEVHRTH